MLPRGKIESMNCTGDPMVGEGCEKFIGGVEVPRGTTFAREGITEESEDGSSNDADPCV